MRAITFILISALLSLWAYYYAAVESADATAPQSVPAVAEGEVSAASLNNEGVRLDRQGRKADALAYFERAHQFRPLNGQIAANYERQKTRVEQVAWLRALIPGSVTVGVLLAFAFVWHVGRAGVDGARLSRLRLRGDPWLRIRKRDTEADLSLRFSEPVSGLLKRHPLTIVWSSSSHGKHMKSRPPVRARGRKIEVELKGERLERLQRYPGSWQGFLYLGRSLVGKAAARVG